MRNSRVHGGWGRGRRGGGGRGTLCDLITEGPRLHTKVVVVVVAIFILLFFLVVFVVFVFVFVFVDTESSFPPGDGLSK